VSHGRRVAVALALAAALIVPVACATDSATGGGGSTGTTGTSRPAPAIPTPVGEGPLPNDVQRRLQAALDDTLPTLTGTPGVLAAVWSPGAGAWAGVAGTADPATKQPLATNVHVRIGGVTTTFTVITLLQLVDQGRLGLDDPIRPWFPDLPDGDRITVRQLAAMTSGIADYADDPALVARQQADPQHLEITTDELIRIGTAMPRAFPPGEGWDSSATNTVMLGRIVEQLTGRPWAEVLQAQLAGPLGLTQTTYPTPLADNVLPKPFAHGFTTDVPSHAVTDATTWNPSWTSSAGAVVSTLQDLEVWAYQLGTGGRLAAATATAQRDLVPRPAGGATGLGLAEIDGWRGAEGSIAGFSTLVAYQPATNTVLVLVALSDIDVGGRSPVDVLRVAVTAALAAVPIPVPGSAVPGSTVPTTGG
jgi:D-alanyl-D-alanine carboxypeptidase